MNIPRLPQALLTALGRRPKPTRVRKPELGVALADGLSGSRFLHGALRDAVAAFPETFPPDLITADSTAFRADLVQASARFEAHRLESTERFAIAQFLARWTSDR